MKPAVFLDRDGTLIEDVHYLNDPAKVRLLAGASEAIQVLKSLGFVCVIVTNQSAVGRGWLTREGLNVIHAEMNRQFWEQNVRLDGLYICTTVPATSDRTTIDDTDRKPGPGMLLRAARDLGLALSESWMVGDMLSDILAGRNAGCRGSILVRTGKGQTVDAHHDAITHIADDVFRAALFIADQTDANRAAVRVKRDDVCGWIKKEIER